MRLLHCLPIKFLPNIVTMMGACLSFITIQLSFAEKWDLAVYMIFTTALLDAFDGRLARKFNATSNFGGNLDSLVDFMSFGIAPSILIYLWGFKNTYPIIGMAISMIFMVSILLRLARFNAENEFSSKKNPLLFSGIPAPVGALALVLPIMLNGYYFRFLSENFINILNKEILLFVYIILMSFLTIMKYKSFSIKNIRMSKLWIIFVLAVIFPWQIIPLSIAIYLFSIPFANIREITK